MKKFLRKSNSILAMAMLLSVGPRVLADPAVSYRTVALSGQAAAGIDPGATFGGFGYSFLDESGHVAFTGYLTGAGITTGNDFGYWVEGTSGNVLWAREGAHAPGTESDTTFRLLHPFNVGFGYDGTLSFGTSLQGASVTSGTNTGIWSNRSGEMELVVRKGDPAAGFASGSYFSSLYNSTISSNGNLGVDAAVYNPEFVSPHGGHVQNALLSSHSGALTPIALAGDAVPGTEPGMYFDRFDQLSITRNGEFLFAATLYGPGVPSYGAEGAWFHSSSGLSLIAKTDSPAPGPSSGYVYNGFHTADFSVNSSGQTAFVSAIRQPSAPYDDAIGLFAGGADSMHYVMKVGDPAPGLPSGVKISKFLPFDNYIPIADSGKMAIHATLSGTGVNSSNSDCIFQGTYDNLSLLAREGDPAPGTPAGVLFSQYPFAIQLNSLGQIAFDGILQGTGVDSSNDRGIWAQDANGVLHLVIREGEPFEVAPGDIRTVHYFQDAGGLSGGSYGQAFNDRGEITFQASFTDGSSGVFVARVPEPSSIALLMSSIAIMLIRSRSRRIAKR